MIKKLHAELKKCLEYRYIYLCVVWHILKFCHFVAEVDKKDKMVLRMKNARGKSAKSSPKWKITIKSVMCHISGTVKHMIMISGTLLLNDDVSRHFFLFKKIFIFGLLVG